MPKIKKLDKNKLLQKNEFQRAVIDTSTINEEERRVSILISTEAPIRKSDWYSGESYDEVLLHGKDNVDLSRAATAKLRFMHGQGKYGELPIGRLENVRIEKQQLRADAIFSKANPDAEMFWQMVLEGTLTEISVGGKKLEVRITERDGEPALVEVVRWEFHEASLVDIGADPAAGIGRSENNDVNLKQGDIMNQIEELRRQLDALTGKNAPEADIQRAQKALDDEIKRVDSENKKVSAENNELKRQASIDALATLYPDTLDADTLKRFKEDPKVDEFTVQRAILDAKVKSQTDLGFQRGADTPVSFNVMAGDMSEIKRAIIDASIMRAGLTVVNPHKNAEVFRNASLLDIARAITGFTGFNPHDLVERAMSTSDFPNLLGNIANAIITQEFERAEGTYHLWVTQVEVKNFKELTEITPDGIGGRFKKVKENGEKANIEIGEGAEKWKIESFGEEITITRQMIINDDFNYFQTILQGWAAKAKRTVNGHVYDLLQSKGDYAAYKMADGIAVFDTATHKNLSAAGAALSTATLTVARTAMKRQKGPNGEALSIQPGFLLVGPEQENIAYQILTSESSLDANQNAGVKNPFFNTMTPIVEDELDAAPWFIAAKNRTIKVGFLEGTNRMPTVKEKRRDLSGVTFECVFDFGLVAQSFRGLYKNAGV